MVLVTPDLDSVNPTALHPTNFEEAYLGYGQQWGMERAVAIYDSEKVVEILMERDGMTHEEAWEFFEFNVATAYVGADTPIFLRRETTKII